MGKPKAPKALAPAWVNKSSAPTMPTSLSDGLVPALEDYKTVKIVSPEPTHQGGQALNFNFRSLADSVESLANSLGTVSSPVSLGTANGLSLNEQQLSLALATPSNAGAMSAADKAKLNGIANGATANSTDSYLLSRSNHTGMQAIGTITNLQSLLDSKMDAATPVLRLDVTGTQTLAGPLTYNSIVSPYSGEVLNYYGVGKFTELHAGGDSSWFGNGFANLGGSYALQWTQGSPYGPVIATLQPTGVANTLGLTGNLATTGTVTAAGATFGGTLNLADHSIDLRGDGGHTLQYNSTIDGPQLTGWTAVRLSTHSGSTATLTDSGFATSSNLTVGGTLTTPNRIYAFDLNASDCVYGPYGILSFRENFQFGVAGGGPIIVNSPLNLGGSSGHSYFDANGDWLGRAGGGVYFSAASGHSDIHLAPGAGAFAWIDSGGLVTPAVLSLNNLCLYALNNHAIVLGDASTPQTGNVIDMALPTVFRSTVTQAANSSTGTQRNQFDITSSWIDSTDATRKGRVTMRVWNTAPREFLRADATGSSTDVTITGNLTSTGSLSAADASIDAITVGTGGITSSGQITVGTINNADAGVVINDALGLIMDMGGGLGADIAMNGGSIVGANNVTVNGSFFFKNSSGILFTLECDDDGSNLQAIPA